jgi:hypothetical protein
MTGGQGVGYAHDRGAAPQPDRNDETGLKLRFRRQRPATYCISPVFFYFICKPYLTRREHSEHPVKSAANTSLFIPVLSKAKNFPCYTE